VTTSRLVRTFLVTLVLVLSTAAALAAASPAGAVTKCGKAVLADWFDNGRIDKLYPLNCYEEAIDGIPPDLRDYADAEDVITRALQAALHGNLGVGSCDPSADGSADDCTNGGGGNGKNGTDGNGSGSENSNGASGDHQSVAPEVDTSAPSSVPIPLLVLGGMSIVLLAAGGLGYVSRRRQAARENDTDDSDTLV
jgi:hypothetical protein